MLVPNGVFDLLGTNGGEWYNLDSWQEARETQRAGASGELASGEQRAASGKR